MGEVGEGEKEGGGYVWRRPTTAWRTRSREWPAREQKGRSFGWRERRRAEIKGNRGRTTTGEGGTGDGGRGTLADMTSGLERSPKRAGRGGYDVAGFGWTRSLAVELGDRWWGERERGGRSRAGLGGVQSWSLQRCRACCKLQAANPVDGADGADVASQDSAGAHVQRATGLGGSALWAARRGSTQAGAGWLSSGM